MNDKCTRCGMDVRQSEESCPCGDHWLLFNEERWVVGCHCGFKADMEEDCGWGDSVVKHLLAVSA